MNINKLILIGGIFVLISCGASKNSTDVREISKPVEEMPEANMDNVSDMSNPSTSVSAQEVATEAVTIESEGEVTDSIGGSWTIVALEDYSVAEEVKVTFTNRTDQTIIVFNPLRKNIERLLGESWVPVEVVYCRCRPCPAPPESREIRPGRSYSVKWSKNEDSCLENTFTQSECKPGIYKISISYQADGVRSVESVEFKI